jgi:cytochrome c553
VKRPSTFTFASWLAAICIGLAGTQVAAQEMTLEQKMAVCTGCHGADGNSTGITGPSLAGQHARYLERQLHAYKDGERPDPTMAAQVLALALSDQDIVDLAAHYSDETIAIKGANPELIDTGERIYRAGIPERDIPACIACHGPQGTGNSPAGYPSVSHQHATYLAKTLRDYRSGTRKSDAELNQMMRNVAELLTDPEIQALANYMQGLN